MRHLALYRKYRPANFESVIGQDHIVRILSSQAKSGKVGHAYLFCGTRGTGKTSLAKIFARAVNCQSLKESGSPCNSCDACLSSLEKGLDVFELDAASNNSVDDVRDIIEKAQYPPVVGRYKVYIVDEVHMLSPAAFNALLKTLEEPPAHCIFILATTEVHKLPATILSRCMRFDFKLVPSQKIAELIKKIYDEIGVKYEDDAVAEIARFGEGSVRDALSIADTCASYGEGGVLRYSDVLEILSATDRGKLARLSGHIFEGDVAGLLSCIEELVQAGKSISMLNRDLLAFMRDLAVVKSCARPEEILDYSRETLGLLSQSARKADISALSRCMEIFSAIETELKYSLHPRVVFEAAALKAAVPAFDGAPERLEQRVAALEREIEKLKAEGIRPVQGQEIGPQPKREEDGKRKEVFREPPKEEKGAAQMQAAPEPVISPPKLEEKGEEKEKAQPGNAAAIWGGVVRALRQEGAGLLYTLCSGMRAEISGNDFIIISSNEMALEIIKKPKNMEKIKSIVNQGREYNIIVRGGNVKDVSKDIEKLRELSEGKLIIEE